MGSKAISMASFEAYDKRDFGVLREEPFQSESQTIIKRLIVTDYKENARGERVVDKVTRVTLFNLDVLDGHEHEEHWRSRGISEETPALKEGAHVK